eukprot:Phypoly_transcript_01867.p1 GENE.Phypoly_transcript_01867~~Phypoly_transcript_01867.p1  ORF type:complete len:897 (+),score=81.10 Phypoly_transcript_01867:37-2727(+)
MLPLVKRIQKHEYIHQGLLESALQQIFPSEDISSNTRKLASIKNPETGKNLELDIVVPTKKLCFEFQDIHHYITTWYYQCPLPSIQNRDIMKQSMVRENGETLVVVPCWWNGSTESLVTTILFQRPDVHIERNEKCFEIPIPLNPSPLFATAGILEVGELMIPCFPMDANFVNTITIDNSWWIGEKYDGIRVCWNPVRKLLYSRKGLTLDFNESLAAELPHAFIDGEIWYGRGLQKKKKKKVVSSEFVEWHMLRYTAFDIVPSSMDDMEMPFEERYGALLDTVPEDHAFVIPSFRIFCSHKKQLVKTLKKIVRKGGEGLILRKPNSLYERGKSSSLLKLKVARGDKEAIVVDVRTSLVILKLPDNTKFLINEPPLPNLKKGDVVTFSYDHFSSKGIPVKPKLLKIRTDVLWKDFFSDVPSPHARNNSATEVRSAGYWVKGKGKNMRQFFENFAWDRGMDPLVLHTWYHTPQSVVMESEAAKVIVRYFDNNYIRTLSYVFPELAFDVSKFLHINRNHYKDASKRRKWFERVALRRGLDPLVPVTWYKLAKKRFREIQGAQDILQYYSNSTVKALVHLFPEIGLELDKFSPVITRHFWRSRSNRRHFFISYAKKKGFEHLVPENWYKANLQHLIDQGANGFVLQFNGSVSSALIDAFPEIGLDDEKFHIARRHHWKSASNRRRFFENIAKKHHFDPLVASNWYSFPTQEMIDAGVKGFLSYYNGSITRALCELFPEIGLDLFQFQNAPKSFWNVFENRRKALASLARKIGIEPLQASHWYSSKALAIVEMRSSGCLSFYEGNIPKALMDAFPDIGLEKSRLNDIPKNYWKDKKNQRKVIESFAQEKGFDALVPSNWYDRSIRPLLKKKTWNFIAYYNGSVSAALVHLFPEIHLEKSKF